MSVRIPLAHGMIEPARDYAILSAPHTSNRHDFHGGGLANKARKMFEGKLGERAFGAWLAMEGISNTPDSSAHNVADVFDFMVGGRAIDVKTYTQVSHRRLLEMVEQYQRGAKDYYVATRLHYSPFDVHIQSGEIVFDLGAVTTQFVDIIGWASGRQVGEAQVENVGYKDNYRIWLDDLRLPQSLIQELRSFA